MRDTFYEVQLDLDVRIAVEFGGRPVDDYAVMLQIEEDDQWNTVFLVDSAHGTHHAHRYTGQVKGEPEPFFNGPGPQAIQYAVRHLRDNVDQVIEDWRLRTAEADHG